MIAQGHSQIADYGRASGPRAGFWRRFAAAFFDYVICLVADFIIIAILRTKSGALIPIAVSAIYATLMIGRAQGQTLGMMAFRIRVISFDGTGPIGYSRALIRWLGSLLSSLIILLGYLWMLWDDEKQCWHDKLANDVVVPVSAYPIER